MDWVVVHLETKVKSADSAARQDIKVPRRAHRLTGVANPSPLSVTISHQPSSLSLPPISPELLFLWVALHNAHYYPLSSFSF